MVCVDLLNDWQGPRILHSAISLHFFRANAAMHVRTPPEFELELELVHVPPNSFWHLIVSSESAMVSVRSNVM